MKTDTIQDKALILIVTLNTLGNFRKVNTEELLGKEAKRMDAADLTAMIHTNKKLFDADELKAIMCLDGDIRRWVGNTCLPSPFKTGTYALPTALYELAEEKLNQFAKERRSLVRAFLATYDSQITAAKRRMDKIRRGLFKRDDYPTKAEVSEKFGFDWQYVEFAAPGSLKGAAKEREAKKIAAQWEDIRHGMKIALREEAKSLADRMVATLAGRDDGKKKIFRNSLVTNVTSWLDMFDPRNGVPEDGELAKLATMMRKLTKGVDPNTLREDDNAREALRTGFKDIAKQLNKLVVEKPKRAVNVG